MGVLSCRKRTNSSDKITIVLYILLTVYIFIFSLEIWYIFYMLYICISSKLFYLFYFYFGVCWRIYKMFAFACNYVAFSWLSREKWAARRSNGLLVLLTRKPQTFCGEQISDKNNKETLNFTYTKVTATEWSLHTVSSSLLLLIHIHTLILYILRLPILL